MYIQQRLEMLTTIETGEVFRIVGHSGSQFVWRHAPVQSGPVIVVGRHGREPQKKPDTHFDLISEH